MEKKIEIEFTPEELPLEQLVELIRSDVIQDEIPFKVLAENYPKLLSEWYPGFPGPPRQMTEDDPVRCQGKISNGFLELPGIGKVPMEKGKFSKEGVYDLFLQKNNQGEWFMHVIYDDEEEN